MVLSVNGFGNIEALLKNRSFSPLQEYPLPLLCHIHAIRTSLHSNKTYQVANNINIA